MCNNKKNKNYYDNTSCQDQCEEIQQSVDSKNAYQEQ